MPIGFSASERKKKLDKMERDAVNPPKKKASDSSTKRQGKPLPKASKQSVAARERAIKAQQEADRKAIAEMQRKKK